MKCTYRINEPRLLLEAGLEDLFVFTGPGLVECVCALASHVPGTDQAELYVRQPHPDGELPVTVIACRLQRGEPGYLPSGCIVDMPAAAPIVFVQRVTELLFKPRVSLPEVSAFATALLGQIAAEKKQRDAHPMPPPSRL